MKFPILNRLSRYLLTMTFAGGLACVCEASEGVDQAPTVKLQKSESGSSCVIVFATVGERFRLDFAKEGSCPSLKCSPGVNASGQESELPAGLIFDSGDHALVGVPQHPGFHEYVVLRTEKGQTSEQVVLIDIQAHSLGAGGMEYASYFAGGRR